MYAHPEYLMETDALAEQLDDPKLRIFDCTVFLTPQADGTMEITSGEEHWRKGHVPGAGFLDLAADFSDPGSPLRFTMPEPNAFADAAGKAGIGDDRRVVLYCAGPPMWATRMWWMLRAMGFDNAAILNGGWHKWQAEGRTVSTQATPYSPATFTARPRKGLFADKETVEAALGSEETCIVDSLTPQMYRGEVSIAARAGHITGAINIPAMALSDPENHTLLSPDDLRAALKDTGADDGKKVITYCGGGIAATQDAFALALLGHDDVAVYDGSMSEWAADPDTPMKTGETP
ncbi:MAG: sulfurtransferase [Alphaproteobacteria bacterium]